MENSAQANLPARSTLNHVGKLLHIHRPGETAAEVISAERPGLLGVDGLRVYLIDARGNRSEIYHHCLCNIRPKPGVMIEVGVGPKGDQQMIIRSLAMIAITVGALYTGGATFGAAGAFGTTGTAAGAFGASTVGQIAVQTGFFAVGMLALNAVLPPGADSFDNGSFQSQNLSIAPSRNRLEPYGVMPMLLGKRRLYPPFATKAFTTLRGKESWVTMMYCVGYKNMTIDRDLIKFGDTLLTDLLGSDEYTLQIATGGSSDDPGGITIWPDSVAEEIVNQQINGPDPVTGGVTRTTPPGTEWITVDISAPLGLLRISNNGKNYDNINVVVVVQVSPAGADTWSEIYRKTWTGRSSNPIIQSFKHVFGAAGSYDVRMYRTSADIDPDLNTSSVYNDDIVFRVLRSFTSTNPVNDPDAALIALEVKATDNFAGTPDTFNCVGQQLIPDWNGSTWVDDQPSRNPASEARHMLLGSANAKPLDLSRIDDDLFQDFHTFCKIKGFKFDQYFDSNGTLWERLQAVCTAGRGRIMQPDGKWLVKYDDIQNVAVKVYTPRNSWGYTGGKAYPDEFHGFRVRFISEYNNLYANDEIIVYRTGYSSDGTDDSQGNPTEVGTIFEALELKGVVGSDQLWKLARYYMNVLEYQMESHTFTTDPSHLRVTPMDRIDYEDDCILVGWGSGRIKSFSGNTIQLDATIEVGSGSNAIQIINENDEVQTLSIAEENVATDTFTLLDTQVYPYAVDDLCVVGVGGKIVLPLLVKDIISTTEDSARLQCVPYSDNVYTDDGSQVPEYDPLISQPPGKDRPVIDEDEIRSDESVLLRNNDGSLTPRILGAYVFVNNRENVAFVLLQYRAKPEDSKSTTTWSEIPLLAADAKEFWVTDVVEGLSYQMRSRFQYRDGINGKWSDVVEHLVIGKTSKPIAPDFLYVFTQSDGTRSYNWEYTKDGTIDEPELGKPVDFSGVEIRYYAAATQSDPVPDWDDMARLNVAGLITSSPVEVNAPISGLWFFAIKAVDTGGRYSENATFLDQPLLLGTNRVANSVVYRDYRQLGWPITDGAPARHENCSIEPEIGALLADGITLWTGNPLAPNPTLQWDDLTSWNTFSEPDFAYVADNIDLGATETYDWYADVTVTNLGAGTAEIKYATTSTPSPAGEPNINPTPPFEQISARNIRWGLYITGADIQAAIIEFKVSAYNPGLGPASANAGAGTEPVISKEFIAFISKNVGS